MGTVDLVILGFTVILAVGGSRRGLLVGVLSVAGFAGGAFMGTRVAPLLLPAGSQSPYAPLLGLAGACVVGVVLSAGFQGFGTRLRGGLRVVPGLRSLDAGLGAVLAAVLALGIAWLAGAVALQAPATREVRKDLQRSAILSRLNEVLPPSGPLLNALARIDPFPSLRGPLADVAPPRASMARNPQVASAAASVVRVLGTACGLGLEGSGWVAGDGLVVTNAHVVAGEEDTTVQVRGVGPRFTARAVFFDARNDLAVLRVGNLQGVPALALADSASVGTGAAVLGFPGNGPYDVRAARLAATRSVRAADAYGRGPVQRSITAFRGRVRPGNSGGPVVDGDGRVVATVFATSGRPGVRTGYGVPNRIVLRALAGRLRSRSTGACAP